MSFEIYIGQAVVLGLIQFGTSDPVIKEATLQAVDNYGLWVIFSNMTNEAVMKYLNQHPVENERILFLPWHRIQFVIASKFN